MTSLSNRGKRVNGKDKSIHRSVALMSHKTTQFKQIDGQLLCSLDKNLLREGFPELNALDVKKIVDFIDGWRPKK